MLQWLSQTFDHWVFDHAATRWVAAALVVFVTFSVLGVAKRLLVKRLRRLAGSRPLSALDVIASMLEKTTALFYLAVGLHLAVLIVEVPAWLGRAVEVGVVLAIFLQAGLWASEGVACGLARYRDGHGEDPARATALSAIRFMARFVIWVAVLLLVLGNLGFDITALIASLGIGGIAVALAVQNILGDLFASLSILVDKPFVIGDFIIVGDFMGTVEKVGLKTTRVRSLSGEQIIFSNTDLLESRVRNYKRMQERRVVFGFGVVYQTETDQIEQIPQMIADIIEQVELTRFDRAHFKAFGESAFDFEVVYYVLSPDFNVYMDIHQDIIMKVLRRFRNEGIAFAYPTRTLHVHGEADDPKPPPRAATA